MEKNDDICLQVLVFDDDYNFYNDAHRGCVSRGLMAGISMANATQWPDTIFYNQ